MDQHDVPQPSGGGADKRKAFEDFRDRAIGSAGLSLVSSMSLLLCPCSVGLGIRGLVWPFVESPLLAVSGRRSLRTSMISLLRGTKR